MRQVGWLLTDVVYTDGRLIASRLVNASRFGYIPYVDGKHAKRLCLEAFNRCLFFLDDSLLPASDNHVSDQDGNDDRRDTNSHFLVSQDGEDVNSVFHDRPFPRDAHALMSDRADTVKAHLLTARRPSSG